MAKELQSQFVPMQEDAFVRHMQSFHGSALEGAVHWIQQLLNPEDVFSTTQLEKWAESEGYVKPENQ